MPVVSFPRWRHVVTALSVVAVLLPAVAGTAAGTQSESTRRELDEVGQRLDEAREHLEEVDEQRKVTLSDLEEMEARRAGLDSRLVGLDADLAARQAVLDEAEAALAESAAELGAAQRRLATTRSRLDRARERFQSRVRASFKYGGTQYAAALLDSDDITDFARTFKYVRAVMANDRDQVTVVAGLEREATAQAEELAALKAQREAQRSIAAQERNQVAALAAEQRDVRRQVAAEAERHRLLLARLESDRASYLTLVSSLEAEGNKLEAELRRLAEEEERRRVEEAARAGRSAEEETAPAGKLFRPARGPITSGYGYREHPIFGDARFHAGIDFGDPTGAPVFAGEAGRVVSAGWRGGYGNAIVIDHGGGLATLYAHLSRVSVSSGSRVTRGQTIGEVGSTGYSTGPHLHFEVRVNGEPRDPRGYL